MPTPSAIAARRPPLWAALAASVVLVIAWGVLRLAVFPSPLFPLTYAVPLLVGVWTRDKRLLWGMAGAFIAMHTWHQLVLLSSGTLPPPSGVATYVVTFVNIVVAAGVVHVIIATRERLDVSLAAMNDQNQVLERQNEELTQQAEELTQQSEEMSQQSEEVLHQNEELQAQAEEINALNLELGRREHLLRTLLDATRLIAAESSGLQDVCASALDIFGDVAAAAAVYERDGGVLAVQTKSGIKTLTEMSPTKGRRFADFVIDQNRTASLNDVSLRPDLETLSIAGEPPFQSVLAAPLQSAGRAFGVVGIYSAQRREWTADEFRLAEWVAARCAHFLEVVRLQRDLRRQAALIDLSPDAIIVRRLDGTITLWSHGAEVLYGWTRAEAIGRTTHALLQTRFTEPIDRINRQVEEGGGWTGELVHTARDGHEVIVESRWLAERDAAGHVVELLESNVDITNRKHVEEELRRLAGQLFDRAAEAQALSDAAPVAVWLAHDPECRRITGNAYADRLMASPRGENISRSALASESPVQYAVFRNGRKLEAADLPAQVAATTGTPVTDQEVELVFQDGRTLDMILNAVPLFDSEGQVRGSLTAGIDITARKRAEETLRQSEEQLRAATTSAGIGVWSWIPGTSRVLVSANWRQMFGVPADASVTFETWVAALHPADRERAVRELNEASGQHREFDTEYRVVRPDGSVAWLVDRGRAWYDDAGRPAGMAGVNVDITARKHAEESLRASESRYALLFENLLDGFAYCRILYDDTHRPNDFVFLRVNEAFGRLTGLDDVVGRRVTEVIPGIWESNPELLEIYARVTATGQPEEFETFLEPLDIWLSVAVYRPEPDHFVAVFDNITERKRALEALSESDRRKSEFLATLSHELRNPLAPIRYALELLRTEGDEGAPGHPKRVIERQLGHLVHLVDDLLDVTRIASNKIRLRPARVDLAAIVQQAVEATAPDIEQAGHTLAISLPAEPVWVNGDCDRLAQVLTNLLNNASRYTPQGGQVTITVTPADDQVVISVRDSGVGLRPEDRDRVFEMFTQVGDPGQGGLGIGLALVKGLVELHQGSVEARSGGPGQGSEFIIRLPRAQSPVEKDDAEEPGKRVHGARRRILVVDDNADSADMLKTLLELHGHDVRIANDGPSAIAMLPDFSPDVGLFDIGLPGMSGYELARRVRTEGRGAIFLVAVTGWGQEEDRQRAREWGFDAHLTKPADPEELARLIATADGWERGESGIEN